MAQVYNTDNEIYNAFVYVYKQSTAGKEKVAYADQPWHAGVSNKINPGNYVWYACYGSNFNKERFMEYIRGCSDNTPPQEDRAIILGHPIYFAQQSSRWDNKGVAFLDRQKAGKAYGRMYLITEQQFKEIHRQEGLNWYNEIAGIGVAEGIPIRTFTHAPRYANDVTPSAKYLEKIKAGLKATYPQLSAEDIEVYLLGSCLSAAMISVLSYLRSQAHGSTVNELGEDLGVGKSEVISAIKGLREWQLIKQDSRTIRGGLAWDADEAIYYTAADSDVMINIK